MPVQPNLGGAFSGTIAVTIVDPGGDPVSIIKTTDAWKMRVTWTITGTIVGSFPHSSDDWYLQGFVETIGPGTDLALGPPLQVPVNKVPATGTPATRTYTEDISVTASLVPAGTYDCAAVITCKTSGTPPVPVAVAAVERGPLLQFYD